MPGASCLTQSLALRYLLAKSGQEGIIRIGATQKENGEFDAHAWVIVDQAILIGGPAERIAPYQTLVDL